MITVGAVHELHFMARHLGGELDFIIKVKGKILEGNINENKIRLSYEDKQIWEEDIYGEANWFGVESCDRIHSIVRCIDDDDDSWLVKYAWRQSDSKATVSLEEAVKNTE